MLSFALIWVFFTYIPATEYTNGEPMAISEIERTCVYCGEFRSCHKGAPGRIGINLEAGRYECSGTHIAGGVESERSNVVVKEIPVPRAPVF